MIRRRVFLAKRVVGSPPLLCRVAVDVLLPALHLGKVKFRAGHPQEDVLDVVAGGLEVGRSVVCTGDENLERREKMMFKSQCAFKIDQIIQVRYQV